MRSGLGSAVLLCLLATLAFAAHSLTNQSIKDLVKFKVSDEVISALIDTRPCEFDTSTDAILDLKQAGVSDRIIELMVRKPERVVGDDPGMPASQSPTEPYPFKENSTGKTETIFAALNYGPKRWSVIRLRNISASPKTVHVVAFRYDGQRIDIPSDVDVQPGMPSELRLQGSESRFEYCYAKVTEFFEKGETPQIIASAAVEALNGNTIQSFERIPSKPMPARKLADPSSLVQGKQLYFLNLSRGEVVLSVCQSNDPDRTSCQKFKPHYRLGENQSIAVPIGALRNRYLVTDPAFASPAQVVVSIMESGGGTFRSFSAESSIKFGSPVK